MAASFDSEISVEVRLDAPPITGQGFGTTLLAADSTSLGAGFTERFRVYTSAREVADDSDLDAGVQAVGAAVFAQTPKPTRWLVGRLEALVAEIHQIGIATPGTEGEDWVVSVLGEEASYTVQNGDAAGDVATGLAAAINALAGVAAIAAGSNITITADNAGQPLNVTVEERATNGTTAADAALTHAVSVADGLDEILGAGASFYGFTLERREDHNLLSAAAWAEANSRLFLAQTSSSGVLSGAYAVDATDIGSRLRAASYRHTALLYHHSDSEPAAAAWAAQRLAVNPDQQTTIWKFATLSGITPSAITSTQKTALLSRNANVYLTFFGSGSTGNGDAADGTKLDLVLTADWLKARVEEALAQLLLNATARGSKLPYTDDGFNTFSATTLRVLDLGVRAGHFVAGTTFVTMPELSQVSNSDRANRHLAFTFGAAPAGAVESVGVVGYVSLDLAA